MMVLSADFKRVIVEALNSRELKRLVPPESSRKERADIWRNDAQLLLGARTGSAVTLEDAAVQRLHGALAVGGSPPKWVHSLELLLEHLRSSVTYYNPGLTIGENFASPIASYVGRQLFTESSNNLRKVLSQTALDSLIKSLRSRLTFTGRHVVDWTWRTVIANRSLLEVKDTCVSEHDWAYVYFSVGVQRRTLSLLRWYPGLARLWTIQGQLWLVQTRQFLRHAHKFIPIVCQNRRRRRVRVAGVDPDRSDLHRGNRSVVCVTFSNGARWYYKPRSGTPELVWARILEKINVLRGDVTFMSQSKVVAGRAHFWMEEVAYKPCKTRTAASEYFLKCGIILYLLYRLRGVDFHAANLVAHGSEPVLVDCETLFHPVDNPGQGSILAVGFMPNGLKRSEKFDSLSALGRLKTGEHTACLGNTAMFACDFVEEMLVGFCLLDGFDKALVNGAINNVLRQSDLRRTRHLFRPTSWYCSVLESSITVEALATGVTRWEHLRHFCCSSHGNGRRGLAEALALEQADIPIFYGKPASPRIASSRGLDREAETLRQACRDLKERVALFRRKERKLHVM